MANSEPNTDPQSDYTSGKRQGNFVSKRIGIALILLSGVLWFSLFAIPFLPLTLGEKGGLAAATFIGVQIAWWTGAAFLGPQAVKQLKGWLWRKRLDDQ